MPPAEIGLFPLATVLVPGELMPLHIFEERYKDLVAECLEREQPFGLIYADDDGAREIGCTARVTEVVERFDDGRLNIVVRGGEVFRVVELTHGRSYMTGLVEPAEDDPASPAGEEEAAGALDLFRRIAELSSADPALPENAPVSFAIASRVELPAHEKQRLLEARSERDRLRLVSELLGRGLEGLLAAAEVERRARTNGRVSAPRG